MDNITISKTQGPTLFLLLFGVSGLSGLIYESIWTHYIKLFLGHAAYAQTLVLAIFMGGMAIGSWIAAKLSHRWKNLLLAYALVEGFIGLAALVFHKGFVAFTDLSFDQMMPSLGTPFLVHAYKWTSSAAIILPQSILLGMTFPLMTGGIIRRFPLTPGASIAMLYFANSLGAAFGVLASGFFLIDAVGLPGTIMTAGLVNVTLALVVWMLSKNHPVAVAGISVDSAGQRGDHWFFRLMLGAALITGAASFLYEIAWIRMLSLVLGSSTHAFELMLSAFILGLALGGLWIRQRIDRLRDPLRFLGYVQWVMGLLALATLPLYGQTFDAMQWALHVLQKNESGYTAFHFVSHVICLLVMLPATFCAGMTLPLITYVLMKRGHGEGSIGAVYASNTLGAIVGVFAAVHLFMPLTGFKGVIGAGALLDAALGMVLLYLARPVLSRRIELPVAAAVAAALITVILVFVQLDPHKMTAGVFRREQASLSDDHKILYRKDGKSASIALIRNPSGSVSISTNGKPDAEIMMAKGEPAADEITMVMLGALPLAIHPGAKTAANIGMGSGLTTHVMLSSPQLESVDTIEIEPFMVEAAEGYRPRNENTFNDPRSRIQIEDAKTFFSTSGKRYDIIVSEPSNPWVSGVASLFSTEFYARMKNYLQPGGVVVQWLHLYEIDLDLVASVAQALAPHFTDYVIYNSNNLDIMIVAKNGGRLPEVDPAVFAIPQLAEELKRVGINAPQDLKVRRLAGKRVLDPLFASFGAPVNSDFFPYLDQNAARARFLRKHGTALTLLGNNSLPVLEMLEGRGAGPSAMQVTFNPHFAAAKSTWEASRIHAALMSGQFERLPPGATPNVLLPVLLLEQCREKVNFELWLDTFLDLSTLTVPHLSPPELDQMLKRIASRPCFDRLPEVKNSWFTLVQALARRDAPIVAEMAERLLNADAAKGHIPRYRYLVTAAMLGHLAQGNQAGASAIWEKYGKGVLRAGTSELDVRLLVALSHPVVAGKQDLASR